MLQNWTYIKKTNMKSTLKVWLLNPTGNTPLLIPSLDTIKMLMARENFQIRRSKFWHTKKQIMMHGKEKRMSKRPWNWRWNKKWLLLKQRGNWRNKRRRMLKTPRKARNEEIPNIILMVVLTHYVQISYRNKNSIYYSKLR